MSQFDQEYFPPQIKLPLQIKQHVQDLKQQIIASIENGNIQITMSNEVVKKKTNNKQDSSNLKNKLKQLDTAKEELAKKLKLIQVQEKEIKVLSNKLQKQNTKNRLQRSSFTQQDKQKILHAKKSHKQFQKNVKQKMKKIMQEIKAKEKQQQEQLSFKNDMIRKERIVKLTQKRLKLAENRSKTLQMLQNSTVGLKKQNYIYIKNEKNDKKLLQIERKNLQSVIAQKKQKFKIDFDQIKKHSEEHDKIINQKKQDFLFQFKQNQIKKRTKTVSYESEFSRKIKQQQRKEKQSRLKLITQKLDLRDRVVNFQSYLTQKFKPKITQQSTFVPPPQSEILNQLSFQQRKKKGNQYLSIAKSRKKRLSKQQINLQTSSDQIGPNSTYSPTPQKQRYHNYLKQFKRKDKSQNALERILKQRRLSTRKMEQVIKSMKRKQEGTKIALNKGPINHQFALALQKINILNSMYQRDQDKQKKFN